MISNHAIHGVLTGDIVNSTLLSKQSEKQLFFELDKVLGDVPYTYYRGDSFQADLEDPASALHTAMLCRIKAKGLVDKTGSSPFDIRVSIGIGPVQGRVNDPGTAKGEAFLLSGRAFDSMELSESKLSIISSNPVANEAFAILSTYVDSIFEDMTGKQAPVIERLLESETIQKIADDLGKSKSTIHQSLVSGRWPELQALLKHFENLIRLIE